MLSTRFGSSPNSNIIIYSYLRNSIYYYNRVSDHIQTTRSVREDNFLINRCTLRVKVNKTFIVSVASCARAFGTSRAFQSGSGALGAHACVLQADLAGFFWHSQLLQYRYYPQITPHIRLPVSNFVSVLLRLGVGVDRSVNSYA